MNAEHLEEDDGQCIECRHLFRFKERTMAAVCLIVFNQTKFLISLVNREREPT